MPSSSIFTISPTISISIPSSARPTDDQAAEDLCGFFPNLRVIKCLLEPLDALPVDLGQIGV
jgi:hypothetical protein